MLKKLINKLFPDDTPEPRVTHPSHMTFPVFTTDFNPEAELPYGVSLDMIRKAMWECIEFIEEMNMKTTEKEREYRIEHVIPPDILGPMMEGIIARSLVRQNYSITTNKANRGYPIIIPAGVFVEDKLPDHSKIIPQGIEIKVIRLGEEYANTLEIVFLYDSVVPFDPPEVDRPFKFYKVITQNDWIYDITEKV